MSDSLWPHLPGSSVHGILQARILEWIAIPFCRGPCQPRDRTWVSHIADKCLTTWARWKALKLSGLGFCLILKPHSLCCLGPEAQGGRASSLREKWARLQKGPASGGLYSLSQCNWLGRWEENSREGRLVSQLTVLPHPWYLLKSQLSEAKETMFGAGSKSKARRKDGRKGHTPRSLCP